MVSKTLIGGGSKISLLQYLNQMNIRWYFHVLILSFLISLQYHLHLAIALGKRASLPW